jgi:hypothetical protein
MFYYLSNLKEQALSTMIMIQVEEAPGWTVMRRLTMTRELINQLSYKNQGSTQDKAIEL